MSDSLENLKPLLADALRSMDRQVWMGRLWAIVNRARASGFSEGIDRAQMADNDSLYVPGELHCPKCGFTLHKRVINAETAQVGVDPTLADCIEACPNDGGPMERTTWKMVAISNGEAAERFAKESYPMRLINRLRDGDGEGDSVEILCDNPEGDGANNCAVVCCGDWTGWQDRRFQGISLTVALEAAAGARSR